MKYSLIWRNDRDKEEAAVFEREVVIGRVIREDPYMVTLIVDGKTREAGIYDASVSHVHARLYIENNTLYVVDVGTRGRGSRNGTYVNEIRVEPGKPRRLAPGDHIRVGLMTFFTIGGVEKEKPVIYADEGEAIVVPRHVADEIPRENIVDKIDIDEDRVAVLLRPGMTHVLPSYDVLVREMGIAGYIGEALRRLVEARRLLTRPSPDVREAAVKLLPLIRNKRYRGILRELSGEEYERLEALVLKAWRGRLEAVTPLLDAIDAVFELIEASR